VVQYPDPESPYLSTDLVQPGAVRTFLAFDDLSESGTFGDPSLASEAKGERFLALSAEALATFFKDLLSWPIPEARK
jgi:creatinine amidohydrolase/Fe(II)-dependent formamide hydrolase-like protein